MRQGDADDINRRNRRFVLLITLGECFEIAFQSLQKALQKYAIARIYFDRVRGWGRLYVYVFWFRLSLGLAVSK